MVTMKEVAKAAEVSTVTASSVLSGVNRVRVSAATRERIHRVAKDMNYVPLAAARGLRTGKTRIIAFVASTHSLVQSDSVWHESLRGVSDLMWEREERLMLVMPRNRAHEMEILRQMAYGRQVDGFIIQDNGQDPERLELVRDSERPFVVMGGVPLPQVNSVSFDMAAFAEDIAVTLQAAGCRSIVGILPAHYDQRVMQPFLAFFQEWSQQSGIPFHPWTGGFVPDGQWLASKTAGGKLGVALHRGLLPETIKALEDAKLTLGDKSHVIYISMGEDILLAPEGVQVMQYDYYTLGRRSARLLLRLIDSGKEIPSENLIIAAAQKT